MSTHLEQVITLSNEIQALRGVLAEKEAFLEALTGGKPAGASSRPAPAITGKGRGGPSVSERVLQLVRDSGSTGIARGEVKRQIGGQDAAVDSAFKVHSQAARIFNKDGRWYAAVYAPTPAPGQEVTRPMRIPSTVGEGFIAGS